MIDEHAARRAVEQVITSWPPSPDPDEAFVVWDVEEHSRAWILHFATRRWIETRAFSDQAVGSCPFVVDKPTGDVHLYGSGEYDKFNAWLDEGLGRTRSERPSGHAAERARSLDRDGRRPHLVNVRKRIRLRDGMDQSVERRAARA